MKPIYAIIAIILVLGFHQFDIDHRAILFAELTQRRADPLGASNRDFEGSFAEVFNVFYSARECVKEGAAFLGGAAFQGARPFWSRALSRQER